MSKKISTTVGRHLIHRLEQMGLKHIFSVPGDYVLGFFDLLSESDIELVGNCNELNAGYAADGYARLNGIGAVCVTYGVGGLSLANAVAGARAERVPMVVVSGGPALSRREPERMLHHTLGDKDLVRQVFEPITCAAVVLGDGGEAPEQIDAALSTCLEEQGPVYIELPINMVNQPCEVDEGFSPQRGRPSDPASLQQAVAAAVQRISQADQAVVWAGYEISRLGVEDEVARFLEHTGLPVATSRHSKGVINESYPGYIGIYKGDLSQPATRRVFEEAQVIVNLGAWPTSVNTGGFTARLPEGAIQAFDGRVEMGDQVFEPVSFPDFVQALTAAMPAGPSVNPGGQVWAGDGDVAPDQTDVADKLTADRMIEIIGEFLEPDNILITDTGAPLISSDQMKLPDGCRCLRQAYYMSIGYAVPAAMGVALAAPEKRPVVIIGDGAFQMTAQAVSTIIRMKLNPIIIVWNNDGYQIERIIHDGPFNDIQPWKYSEVPHCFGGASGERVASESELKAALSRAKAEPQELAFIEVVTERWDLTRSMEIARQAMLARKK